MLYNRFEQFITTILISLSIASCGVMANQNHSKLFSNLPENCPTPDAFDIAPNGSLTLSCPNFANKKLEGELLTLLDNGDVKHLATVPRLSENRKANPMGIAYGKDGGLYIADARGVKKGRILKLTFVDNKLIRTDIIASGLNPNGVRYHNGAIYVTQPKMPKIKSAKNTSGIYRFEETDRDIKVSNTLKDKNLIFSVQTENPDKKIGLDGLAFDSKGFLYTANLGDGIVYKLELSQSGGVLNQQTYANVPKQASVDGMIFDENDNLYLAGFASNQILKIDTEKNVTVLADFPDNDGSNGQLDQPADLMVYKNMLVISNFDLLTGKGFENSKHGKPYTISYIPLFIDTPK